MGPAKVLHRQHMRHSRQTPGMEVHAWICKYLCFTRHRKGLNLESFNLKTQIKTFVFYLIISGILVVLTHQYKSTVGQSGQKYFKWDNRLTEIPADIPPGVVEVTIYSQSITTIKTNTFLQLSQCARLRLGPKIFEIESGAFNGLTALTYLSLGYRLERLYINMFSGISSCEILDLGRNQISEIEPGSFSKMNNLDTLYLNSNSLTTLKAGTFQGLLSARTLILENNTIKLIKEDAFISLKTIEKLDLSRNLLEILNPVTFCGLDSLRRLSLKRNRLTTLSADVFNHLPRPLSLDLTGNQLECNATLCWLKQEELDGTITWNDDVYNFLPKCANEENWHTWYCSKTSNYFFCPLDR